MISVCMATFNGEKYIREQIESILSQLSLDDELIISDDMSTDKTMDIIKEFKDPRLKVFIHKDNHGFVKNFENALTKARGDVIFLSDQDDIRMPEKVQVTLKELECCDFTVSDCITINKFGEIISESRIDDFNIKTGFLRVMVKTRYIGCCMAFKRNVLDAALPFPTKVDLVEHDTWLASVAELYFNTTIIHKPLIKYRRHDTNTSSGGEGRGYPLPNKIYRRLYRIKHLIRVKRNI